MDIVAIRNNHIIYEEGVYKLIVAQFVFDLFTEKIEEIEEEWE